MDVSFAAAALRRYLSVVLLCTTVGVVVALSLGLWTQGNYESKIVLEVRPPTGANVFYEDSTLYIVGQMIKLRSDELAHDTSDLLARSDQLDMSALEVHRIVTIEQRPFTEIVDVVATGTDPELVRAVAVRHVDAYLASIPTAIVDEDHRSALEADAAELTSELAGLDDRIQAAMAPYLSDDGGWTDATVPTPETVVPAAMSRRELVQAELEQISWALLELERNSRVQNNTIVLAHAPPTAEKLPLKLNLGPAAAIPIGVFVGLFSALLAARLSSRPLDE